ncbi:ROK family transcriptional regulator [Streptomyces sp. CC208A]|uniref:ROK family transcriptional regulator n=1 Tax=Streptomyces sp. CC208A TaxID=3044573 RepID=UPI0032C0633A
MTELVRGHRDSCGRSTTVPPPHLLLRQGPLTRPEISRLTGLSKPTASQVLARLEEAGLVVGNGLRTGLPGRVPETYRVNPAAGFVAAVDVTPEWIAVRAADITGAVLGEAEAPVPAEPSREALVEALRTALGRVPTPRPPMRVVIGVQGAVDPTTGRLAYAGEESMAAWLFPGVERTLGAALGLPVRIENDVSLAAVAERAQAPDRPDFVLLRADEGLGAALVIGGRLHRGYFGGAGEVGYLPLPGAPTAREAGDPYGRHGCQELAGGDAVREVLRAHGVPGADFAEAVAGAVRGGGGAGAGQPAGRPVRKRYGTGRGRAGGALPGGGTARHRSGVHRHRRRPRPRRPCGAALRGGRRAAAGGGRARAAGPRPLAGPDPAVGGDGEPGAGRRTRPRAEGRPRGALRRTAAGRPAALRRLQRRGNDPVAGEPPSPSRIGAPVSGPGRTGHSRGVEPVPSGRPRR